MEKRIGRIHQRQGTEFIVRIGCRQRLTHKGRFVVVTRKCSRRQDNGTPLFGKKDRITVANF